MLSSTIVVLKFGGSVLGDDDGLMRAVHEIYRWRRRGHAVVAVVSALAQATDQLLSNSRTIHPGAAPHALAEMVALGERHSAARLNLYLDRAGIPAIVQSPATLAMIADGSSLDATPHDIDVATLRRALDTTGVVVVPGFVAVDRAQRTVVLGRGGSDMTALFLAHRLEAGCCRLLKDVDGLYALDPATTTPRPPRYAAVTWEQALSMDESVLQHKAIRFAMDHRTAFELGRLNGVDPTRIGPGPSRPSELPDEAPRLRVVLLGCGTVGGGVYAHLMAHEDLFDVTLVAIRDRTKGVEVAGPTSPDPTAAAATAADVVIELLGGIDPAKTAIETALRNGAHVVTANKAVIAEHGSALAELAAAKKVGLYYSAAVGGSMPILEALDAQAVGVRRIRGVLNGTTNYILNCVRQGDAFDAALAAAQHAGFAERDPSRDLGGLDAADKLSVMAHHRGVHLPTSAIQCTALTEGGVDDAVRACRTGHVLRHVGELEFVADGAIGRVDLVSVGPRDALFDVPQADNAATIEFVDGTTRTVYGQGAGRWPTAEAVFADVQTIARGVHE
jgi:homoserine dehydrogenase